MMKTNACGFSLIEMMIAIGIGALLTAGVIEIFISNKVNFNIQNGLARLQENGRFAKMFLARDIRMAGYQGCTATQVITPTILMSNPPATVTFNDADIITGHEATSATAWSPALPASLVGKVKGGTDVIVIRKASNLSVNLQNNLTQATDALTVADRIGIQTNNVLFVTDCETTDIICASTGTTATNVAHTTACNTSASLSKAYQTDTKVMKFEYYAFYIKDSGRTNETNQPIHALYRIDLNGTEQELVDGIEDLQITYGIDTTGDKTANTYTTANTVNTGNNWPNVVSVKINSLLNTIDEVNPEPQAYTFNGTTVSSPNNRMLHREWKSYIKLRNRGL